MTYKRIIPCLDVKDGRVVKGVRFEGLRDAGDPVELAARYDEEGADELFLLDIGASGEGRSATLDLVKQVASRLSIPLTVGGGISSVEAAAALLDAGADKVSIGSAAVRDPDFIARASQQLGSAAVVVSLDVRRSDGCPSGYELVTGGGRQPTGHDAVAWARRMEKLGAGELLLNSIDGDGTREGYDNRLNRLVVGLVDIPVIASGGAGSPEHLLAAFVEGGVDAVLAASMFHYGHHRIADVKAYLHRSGIAVREVRQGGRQGTEV